MIPGVTPPPNLNVNHGKVATAELDILDQSSRGELSADWWMPPLQAKIT